MKKLLIIIVLILLIVGISVYLKSVNKETIQEQNNQLEGSGQNTQPSSLEDNSLNTSDEVFSGIDSALGNIE
ncbi:MAG: hypothetical protein AABY10_05710 [Nanoarchaeota archaeon]